MNRSRRYLCGALCAVSLLWALPVLFSHWVRYTHADLVVVLRQGKDGVTDEALLRARSDYQRALQVLPCHAGLQDDELLLLAQQADAYMRDPDSVEAVDALENLSDALGRKLACTPLDGKVWLDFAALNTLREGFAERSLAAYRMSAYAAPRESWLAQKRLLFALQFHSLFDASAREIARRDIAVLAYAHPNRLTAVMRAADVTSSDALREIFAEQDEAIPIDEKHDPAIK